MFTHALAVAIALSSVTTLFGQVGQAGQSFLVQGNKLTAALTPIIPDGWAFFGESLAMSADGNTAVIATATGATYEAGRIYARNNGVWSQSAILLGEISYVGGGPVAMSADGNTVIVGARYDGPIGAAQVFTRGNGSWSQQGRKLVGAGAVVRPLGGVLQGASVALSSDGNTAIIGGSLDGTDSMGAAWVFTRTNGVWSQQGNKLVGSGAVGPRNSQGRSVAISGDGIPRSSAAPVIAGGSAQFGSSAGRMARGRNERSFSGLTITDTRTNRSMLSQRTARLPYLSR